MSVLPPPPITKSLIKIVTTVIAIMSSKLLVITIDRKACCTGKNKWSLFRLLTDLMHFQMKNVAMTPHH